MISFCKRCLYSTLHPLGLILDAEGVCSGCRVHEEKNQIDWNERFTKLVEIVNGFRSDSKARYDCIVPVSGGRDSFFIVHTVIKKLGLKPLLVTYNRHYNTVLGQINLARLKTHFNCDAMEMLVATPKVKRVIRETLTRIGSMHWHAIAGQTVFPVQIAVRFKIPLIIWGHHQGLDQVGMFSHLDEVEMARRYRKDHDLMGVEAEDLALNSAHAKEEDLAPFLYPQDTEIQKSGVRGIYLGNYIRWDTKIQHETMIKECGYRTQRLERTFDAYNDVDCFYYSGVHDWIKYLKHGYSKVVDHATREIRFGRLTRGEARNLVNDYLLIEPRNLPDFLDWIQMSSDDFFRLINQHRNPLIWSKLKDEWQLRKNVVHDTENESHIRVSLPYNKDITYLLTEPVSGAPNRNPIDRPILLDRGYI